MEEELQRQPETALDALRRWTQDHGLKAGLDVRQDLGSPAAVPLEFERVSDEDTASDNTGIVEEMAAGSEPIQTFEVLSTAYQKAKQELEATPEILEAVDLDGWKLEKSQLLLVEETQEDLKELKLLLSCCQHPKNRQRLCQAINEFEVKLRCRLTWGWFPLTRYQWSGFEYQQPVIVLDFHVPGVGLLPSADVHCDFGIDWFDLKVWNVEWPEDPGVKYHHRVKKTRLMRDIVPSECSVEARGDHLYVKLQKVQDPRHGYCAWSDLSAGRGRKPFKYLEDAPDGGLMNFLEGEYEKYEGYDSFRRDVGQAMEQVHRHQPVRGFH